jgi:imidazolonepropionase-like amidohydrolase
MLRVHLTLLAVFLLAVQQVPGDEGKLAIVGATVHTCGPEGTIENCTVLINSGKIEKIGKGLKLPDGYRVLDARGKHLTPGLIDIHSHLGVYSNPPVEGSSDGNEMINPVTPHVRALDAFNFQDEAVEWARSGGVTTICSIPGSGNVIGGQGILLKLKKAPFEEMILKPYAALKMALELNPINVYGRRNQAPMTRMACYYLARDAFRKAQDYMEEQAEYEKKKAEYEEKLAAAETEVEKAALEEPQKPKRDLQKEALAAALRREVPVHIHNSRYDEIMSAVRLAEEFNLDMNLGHAEQAHKVGGELARRGIVSAVGPRMFYADAEDQEHYVNIPAALFKEGGKMTFTTDSPVVRPDYLIYNGQIAYRYGMPAEEVLKALTIAAAEAIHIEDRIGSLEAGKDADLVVWSGFPLDIMSVVERTYIDGVLEYRRGEQ